MRKIVSLSLCLAFLSILLSTRYISFVYAAKVACNACIYHAVASNLNTHILGSKNHYVDFEFEIPCTFYSPMITVSVPNGFKINSLRLLPATKIGKFQDMDAKCDNSSSYIDYKVSKGIVNSNEKVMSGKFDEYAIENGIKTPECELNTETEVEFFDILTALGFQSWEVVSQNTSKCLEIPNYVTKSTEVLKLMGNLNNGSYILRFDLQNPEISEFTGNWNLSITSTKNNMPTIPFCLTKVNQESVANTLGPLMSPLSIKNATFDSFYKGSQMSRLIFTLDHAAKGELPNELLVGSEPVRIRLTFPECEYNNDCFRINADAVEGDFCEITNHNYECYIQTKNPQLILILGLSESTSRKIDSIFPMKIVIKNLEVPKELGSDKKVKIDVLVGSVPSSKPEFLSLNETVIDEITAKNECMGEWIRYLFNNKDISNIGNQKNDEKLYNNINYSPISTGTYTFPKMRDINVKIRYRMTESELYPVLVRIGKTNGKIKTKYNLKIRPLLKNVYFVKEELENEIAYSNILLRPLIYDKSLHQENVRVEYDIKTNSIVLFDIDPHYPFECILQVNGNNLNLRVASNGGSNSEKVHDEWEVELYSNTMHNGVNSVSKLVTKKIIKGEVYDGKETNISEVSGPFVFIDSNNNYSMVIYFYILKEQKNKFMAINLGIPNIFIEELNEELNVGVHPPTITSRKPKIFKYIKKKRVLTILLDSQNGFMEGWWGLSIQITKPSMVISIENNIYVDFSVSTSESTIENPYFTSLLFLSVNENYMGPYLEPRVNKLLDYSKRDYFFQLISVQQSHSSYHPFPLLKNQAIKLETNSPDYLITKLTYKENFRYVYIIDEPSLEGKEINFNRMEFRGKNIGNSECTIFLVIGNGYYKQSDCKKKVRYTRIENSSKGHGIKKSDNSIIIKIIKNILTSKEKYVMNLLTLIIKKSNVEQLDKDIFSSKEISPNERINYNFIIKKEDIQVLTSRLNLDPDPKYYDNYSQFSKLLIYNQYYNLYTVPSSINALKICPPEIPLLSNQKAQSHPLLFRFKYFDRVITSYNYSTTH
ncbi:hypothetical protein FG386_003003 [Cryptosporidium ryanae]|uniref:uncharacterized protein n=1 Tax=Cryptosporidium ryanae TaxID=515981 RepID=UPI00351A2B84|nr:hypothetical protein FG386_003003 [Cryptosporidium ryanae]